MKSLLVTGLLAVAVAGVGVARYAAELRDLARAATGSSPELMSKIPPNTSKQPPETGGVIG